MSTGPAVRKFLDLSTNHLPETLLDTLNQHDGVIADRRSYGWLLWVPDDPEDHAADYLDENDDESGVPAEVLAIQTYARRFGCDYVLLDADGPTDEELPTFDHH